MSRGATRIPALAPSGLNVHNISLPACYRSANVVLLGIIGAVTGGWRWITGAAGSRAEERVGIDSARACTAHSGPPVFVMASSHSDCYDHRRLHQQRLTPEGPAMGSNAISFLLGLGAAWLAPTLARVLRPLAVEATAAGMGLLQD